MKMVEKIVLPSELHLKKELCALQKARYFRDPETCSSWRSPLSSKSVSANNLCHDNKIRHFSSGEKISSGLLEMPRRQEKIRKKVYLCNWKNLSSLSAESGIKLDNNGRQLSVKNSFEDNLGISEDYTVGSDRKLVSAIAATDIRNASCRDLDHRSRRLKKTAISKKCGVNHLSVTKQIDLPISPLGVLSSIEQSDDTEHSNSEDEQDLGLDVLCKNTYHSPSKSPLRPGSGCANWSRTSKLFRSSQSCTPASTSSCYRKIGRKCSPVGSCSGTTASFEGVEFDQLDLPVRQGCGLPCYWSMRTRDRGCRDCYSPALSDTARQKGGSFLNKNQTLVNKPCLTSFNKPEVTSTFSKSLPLLTNNCDNMSSDEFSTTFGEIDMEALNRLDGRRWPICKSQEAFELTKSGENSLKISHNNSNLIHKPRNFDEIIGQNIVVQSLINAVHRGRIAPAYLFHGPPGTGKKSAARIFAAALNCAATEGNKPCSLCKECTAFNTESRSFVREASGANKKSIERVWLFLKNATLTSRQSRYSICIIDECHSLTSKMWSKFLRFFEGPTYHTVFIFITVDFKHLSQSVISRVQKFLFSKIKEADMIHLLRKLSAAANLDIDTDAWSLIAVHSDGSLQNAETMLYQLSLLGKRITTTTVNDLVGAVSEEKLLDLLEVAMSSNTVETVKMCRELMDSGVDPMFMISQLAGLIMDIIAGTKQLADSQYNDEVHGGRSLTEDEMKKLELAVKILSDAEKQLKHSSEHSSLLTSALQHIASGKLADSTQPKFMAEGATSKSNGSIKKCSTVSTMPSNLLALHEPSSAILSPTKSRKSSPRDFETRSPIIGSQDPISAKILSVKSSSFENAHSVYNPTQSTWNLTEIWRGCIEKCRSKTLRKMLAIHGKLISLTVNEGILIAFVAFADNSIKSRARRYSRSITNLLEMVLQQNVHVKLCLFPNNRINFEPPFDSSPIQSTNNQSNIVPDGIEILPNKNVTVFSSKVRDNFDGASLKKLDKCSRLQQQGNRFQCESFSVSSEGNNGPATLKEKVIESAFCNGGSGKMVYDPSPAIVGPSKHWEDEGSHEMKALKQLDIQAYHNAPICEERIYNTVSPSLLHSKNFGTNFDKENSECESKPGCSGLFCWKTNRSRRQQLKRGVFRLRFPKATRILLCGQRVKSKMRGSRSRR